MQADSIYYAEQSALVISKQPSCDLDCVRPDGASVQEGGCKATWKRYFKLPWREAGPPDHHVDKVNVDQ